MLSIPPYILAIGVFMAWIGLLLIWTRHVYETSEKPTHKSIIFSTPAATLS